MGAVETNHISIIINCFNGEQYLRQALDSVFEQTYENWELIFWDNKSTDDSANIVKNYSDPRIRYFSAPRHTSLGEARNLAVRESNGQWIAFLDCDDLWTPDKLELQVKLINTSVDQLGVIYCKTLSFSNAIPAENANNSFDIKKDLIHGSVFRQLLLEENFVALSSALIYKVAFFEMGGIPSNYFQSEDYYMFAKIAERYAFGAINKVCCYYRIHANNLTKKQKSVGYLENARILESCLEGLLKVAKSREIDSRLRYLYTFASIMLIFRENNFQAGLRLLFSKGGVGEFIKIWGRIIYARISRQLLKNKII